MSKSKPYAERLKKMKESIKENKDLLEEHFPDDATTTGHPDFIRNEGEPDSDENKETCDNEKARSKKSE